MFFYKFIVKIALNSISITKIDGVNDQKERKL